MVSLHRRLLHEWVCAASLDSPADELQREGKFSHPAMVLLGVLLAGLWIPSPVEAVIPETGVYLDMNRQGSGFNVDYQNGILSVGVYSYEPDGNPVFYVGAAALRNDLVAPARGIDPPLNTMGYYPLHGAMIDLHKVTNGTCFGCGDRGAMTTTRVGSAIFSFPEVGMMWVSDYVIEGDGTVVSEAIIFAERVNFARDRHAPPTGTGLLYFHDLSGEWVFVATSSDQTWRFNFSERVLTDGTPATPPFTLTYTDPQKGARLVCRQGYPLDESTKTSGCELDVEGGILLSFRSGDIGLNRVQGAMGALPRQITPFDPSGPYRNPDAVVGLRVEDEVLE